MLRGHRHHDVEQRPCASGRGLRASLALSVGVLAFVLAGCLPAPQGTPKQRIDATGRRCTVGLVGDSLGEGINQVGGLAVSLARRGCALIQVDVRRNRNVAQGAEIVERWAGTGQLPEVLIVILGTNDCSYAAMNAGVRRILDAAGPDRPIVWQNVYRGGCDEPVNRALDDARNALLARPDGGNVWIVNHSDRVSANRSLVTDGVHMRAAGYRDDATILADTVSAIIVK